MSVIVDEEALLDALTLLSQESGSPDSLWHPKFGWVMLDNKPTETTEAFAEWLRLQGSNLGPTG